MILTLSYASASAQQEKQPDLAFLEYLAELENVDGQWVDAVDVATSEQAIATDATDTLDTTKTEKQTKRLSASQSAQPDTTQPNPKSQEAQR